MVGGRHVRQSINKNKSNLCRVGDQKSASICRISKSVEKRAQYFLYGNITHFLKNAHSEFEHFRRKCSNELALFKKKTL